MLMRKYVIYQYRVNYFKFDFFNTIIDLYGC